MTRHALAFSIALSLLGGASAFASSANNTITTAQADITVGPRGLGVQLGDRDRDRDWDRYRDRDRYRDYDRDRRFRYDRDNCRTVIIRERHEGEVMIRRIRQCD